MKRCFISIDIPEEIRSEVIEIQRQLPEFRGKVTEPENLHLTLKFLGEVDEGKVEEVKKRLSGIKFERFEAEVDEVGVFSEKFVRIVWLHLGGCEELQKKVDSVLEGIFPKERRFMSHLTIARVKSVKNKKRFLDEFKKIKLQKIKFNVDSFRLKESVLRPEGPVYKIIEEYPLKMENIN